MSSLRPVLTCGEHGREIIDKGEAIEHLRAMHVTFIRRAGSLGQTDAHGHCWYCKECDTDWKDHRSFNSNEVI
ncbi:hypothetical protein NXS19_006553 [Fusarium pseudograminearum]|nr:hypothetical protein NXS19_006553 [Fusarium pseudograminearum]